MSKRSAALNQKPVNEARPLGTRREKTSKKQQSVKQDPSSSTSSAPLEKKLASDAEKVVDSVTTPVVTSSMSENTTSAAMTQQPSAEAATQKRAIMDITLTRDNKPRKSSGIVYTAPNLRTGFRLTKSAFIDGNPPETLTISSDAFAPPKVPAAKMTPEERKAARLARPKLTKAQKAAKLEERLAKLRAELATETVEASTM